MGSDNVAASVLITASLLLPPPPPPPLHSFELTRAEAAAFVAVNALFNGIVSDSRVYSLDSNGRTPQERVLVATAAGFSGVVVTLRARAGAPWAPLLKMALEVNIRCDGPAADRVCRNLYGF